VLTGERLLAAAGDVDPAELAVDRRRDQIEMPAETAEALDDEKVQAPVDESMGFDARNP
jgi:hypothetical protein